MVGAFVLYFIADFVTKNEIFKSNIMLLIQHFDCTFKDNSYAIEEQYLQHSQF